MSLRNESKNRKQIETLDAAKQDTANLAVREVEREGLTLNPLPENLH
jgi:hypothetical protein